MEKIGLSLVRDKGKEIPALVLESALLHYGAAVSVAYAHGTGGVPVVEIFQQGLKDIDHPAGALGFVKDLLEETKDHKIVIHFSSNADDLQPFVLVKNDKNQAELVSFLVGDFSEHRDTAGHSQEFTEASEYLTPKLLELYEKVDDNIPKLMTKLKEPNITRELSKMGAGDFLNCTLLASNGDVLGYCRPKSPPVKYDWGSASSDLDEHKVETAKPVAAVTAEVKQPTLAERMAAKKAAARGEAPPVKPAEEALPPGQHRIGETKPVEPAVGKPLESLADRMKAKKEEKAGTSADKSGEAKPALHVVGIPPTFDKVKNRRKWFAQRGLTGEVGVDFPDWPTRTNPILVQLYKLQAVHGKQTVEELIKKFPIATDEEIKLYKGSQVPLEKKAEPATPAPAAAPITPVLPGVVPAEQKKHLREKFLSNPLVVALVDKKGQSIMDPTFLPAMEDKTPLFTEDLGLPNIHAADWWKIDQFLLMGNYSVHAVCKAAFQYKMLWLKSEAEVLKLKGEPLPGSTTVVGGTEANAGPTLAQRMEAKRKKQAA